MQKHLMITRYVLSTEAYVNARVPLIYFSTSKLYIWTSHTSGWGEIQKLQGSDVLFSLEGIYKSTFTTSKYTFMNVLLATFLILRGNDEQI